VYLNERARYTEQYQSRLLNLKAHDLMPPKL
jgi:hypothetical protein